MGFDAPGKTQFTIPVSDTRAYKEFGNAVVVPVVEAVARHVAPWIGAGKDAGNIRQLRLRTSGLTISVTRGAAGAGGCFRRPFLHKHTT